MQKRKFLKIFSERSGINYKEAAKFYDNLIKEISSILKRGESIRITGFGEFKIKKRSGRNIFNRFKNRTEYIKPKLLVHFSPSKSFTEKVNAKYASLKPLQLEERPEEKMEEFELTFFEGGGKVQEEKETELKIEAPVEKEETVEEKEEKIEETKIKEEEKMPEFNLSEGSEKKEPKEPKETKRVFDDFASREPKEEDIIYSYGEEKGSKVGLWVFLSAIILIFIGGVIFLLNYFGYIHLWGKGEEVVEFREPEKVEFTPIDTTTVVAKPETVMTVKTTPVSKPVKPVKPAKAKPKIRKSRAGTYIIQVASFQDKKLADKYASKLKKMGYNAYVEKAFVEWKGGNWYRVRIGYFDSAEKAKEVARKLKSQEKLEKIWITLAKRAPVK